MFTSRAGQSYSSSTTTILADEVASEEDFDLEELTLDEVEACQTKEAIEELNSLITEITKSGLIDVDGSEDAFNYFEFGSKDCCFVLCVLLCAKIIFTKNQAPQDQKIILGIYANRLHKIIEETHQDHIQECLSRIAIFDAYTPEAQSIQQASSKQEQEHDEMVGGLVDHFTGTQTATLTVHRTTTKVRTDLRELKKASKTVVNNAKKSVRDAIDEYTEVSKVIVGEDKTFKDLSNGAVQSAINRIKT